VFTSFHFVKNVFQNKKKLQTFWLEGKTGVARPPPDAADSAENRAAPGEEDKIEKILVGTTGD